MFRALLVSLAAALAAGCATYSDEIRPIREAAAAGRPEDAVLLLSARLGVSSAAELPANPEGDEILWLLERAALLQAAGEYRLSARDFAAADRELETLDVARADSLDLARYLYSDSAVDYRAPPFERLLLNSLNMVNFLALGDYAGARVEVRRFRVFEDFVENAEDREALAGTLALGNYLSGLVFELSGDYPTAARHYGRAIALGARDPSLAERLVALLRVTRIRLPDADAGPVAELAGRAAAEGPLTREEYARTWRDGQVVVVVQTGFVPMKHPERIGLATALAWAGLVIYGPSLSADDTERLGRLLAEGVVKWVNFPVLVASGPPPVARVEFDGASGPPVLVAGTAAEAVSQYERMKGTMMVSALTRLLTRFAAGQLTREALDDGDDDDVLAWLAGLVVEGTMAALDRPDTRSWVTLPGAIAIHRAAVPPGPRRVVATVGGYAEAREFTMTERGTTVLNFSRLR